MENRKRLWWLGAIVTFGLFYFIIPPVVYNSAPFILSFVGAALLIFFVTQALWDFKSFKSFNKPKPEEVTPGHKYAPFMVIPGIIMSFIFFFHSTQSEKEELQKDGVIVTAVVMDGKSTTVRRSTTYKLELKYTTKEGKTYTSTESVSSTEFSRVYLGQEIPVIYSQKNPELVEPIISDEAVQKYLKIDNRNLSLKDLFKLYDTSSDSIPNYLNKISYKWVTEKDSFRIIWHNASKEEAVVRHLLGTLTYIYSKGNGEIFEEIKQNGFHKIEKDSTGTVIYENKDYRISTSSETKITEGEIGISVINIVEILKISDPKNLLNQLEKLKTDK
jgi:hypothetical protein